MPGYDPRAVKGLGVTFATSPMGADHTAGQTIRAQIDHRSPEGQVELSKNAQTVNTIWDILGMCMFSAGAVQNRWEIVGVLVSAYTGENFTGDVS
ncbi:aldehyde ferredoxin oxidoreductase C-terminal domain-containing protein [Bacillaceae bacterium IKA-2]|nr:aldehyde ferredoxin oxidoreductase C-terminal domain-containing protein [Bacillaceae bacterium IKA-2]